MSVQNLRAIDKVALVTPNRFTRLIAEMFMYGFVSVFALVVDVGLLYLLVEKAGMHHIVAASLSFTGGLIVNYCLARAFVFRNGRLPMRQEFTWYALIGVIGLGLNDLIIYLLVSLQVWYMYAKAVSVALVFFFNFFSRRRLFECQ